MSFYSYQIDTDIYKKQQSFIAIIGFQRSTFSLQRFRLQKDNHVTCKDLLHFSSDHSQNLSYYVINSDMQAFLIFVPILDTRTQKSLYIRLSVRQCLSESVCHCLSVYSVSYLHQEFKLGFFAVDLFVWLKGYRSLSVG